MRIRHSVRVRFAVSSCAFALALAQTACSSGDASPVTSTGDAGSRDGSSVPAEAGAETTIEHGTLYDYGEFLVSRKTPVRGLTITSGTQTTTTDMDGKFSLVQPRGVPLNVLVGGASKANPYAKLYLPEVIFMAGDGDRGDIILPDLSTFQFEEVTLSNDTSKAVVNIIVVVTGACASPEGGTITVLSPAGAKVRYIDSVGYPHGAQKSITARTTPWHAAAAVFDVEPGAKLDVTVQHPTCKQLPFPATYNGLKFTGNAVTKPSSEDTNSALVLVLGDGDRTSAVDAGTNDSGANDAATSTDASPAADAAGDASDDAAID